jgi:hypothetical protein
MPAGHDSAAFSRFDCALIGVAIGFSRLAIFASFGGVM